MYQHAVSAASAVGAGGTLAFTGAEHTGWGIVAATAIIAAGLALRTLMPKRRRRVTH